MKKIIISILLMTSLPLIGSTDNPKKQLPWTEKGTILRKHLYKYAVPTLIITNGLAAAIIEKQESPTFIGIKSVMHESIYFTILYPILPYIVPIFPKPSIYIVDALAGTLGVGTTLILRNSQKEAAGFALATACLASISYGFHKGFKEIQEKTDALPTRTQHVG